MLTRAFARLGFYASKVGSWLWTPRYHPEERISKLHREENLNYHFYLCSNHSLSFIAFLSSVLFVVVLGVTIVLLLTVITVVTVEIKQLCVNKS